ncbi:MAG: NTP transferase domain-containing protein [Methanobacteriota archaeon]
MISAIVLAAGTSSRMAEPKARADLDGRPLLDHVLDAVRSSRADEIVVVLGHEADRVREAAPLEGTTVVVNPDYRKGMSTSIRAGLRAARADSAGFLIVLGDQPFVSAATIDELIAAHAQSGARILIPTFQGIRGNPVLVDGSLSDEMESIAGDQGCRAIFGRHAEDLLEVPVRDAGVLIDLDTPEELARAREALRSREPLASLARDFARPRRHRHGPAPSRSVGSRRKPRVDLLALAADLQARNEPFALATVVRAERPTSGKPGFKAIVRPDRRLIGWLGGSCATSVLISESLAALRDGRARVVRLSPFAVPGPTQDGVVEYVMECQSGGAMDIYIEPHLPKAQLVIVGDSPVAEALTSLGRILDYRVVAVAPMAPEDAFPDADEVVRDLDRLAALLGGSTYAVVATMGRYDEAALRTILGSQAPYVGLVASRRRADAVRATLRRTGVSDAALERLRSPAGIDVRAQTPEEIAVSIAAEITQVRRAAAELGEAARTVAPETSVAFDVVCGMEVDRATPLTEVRDGSTYYFCSEGCRARFREEPSAFA